MRTFRRISLPAHALVELVVGLTLVMLAIVADLGTTGQLVTFAAGVLVTGAGLGAADGLSVSAHQSLDRSLAVLLAAGAVLAASAGSGLAALVLLAAATVQLVLTGVTRWTRVAAIR